MKVTGWKLLCSVLLAVAIRAPAQKPDAAEQSRALAALRDYALNYTKSLPDFICTQVIERAFGVNGRGGHDAIEEQVTYVGGKENYVLTRINGQPVSRGQDQVAGIVSSGEFGSLLASAFNPQAEADVHWERVTNRNGRKVYVFAYRVPQQKGYGLVESTGTRRVPYKGLIYADAEAGAVVRIEMQCEIPDDSEFRTLEIDLDYKPAEVGGREFLLPSHYRLFSRRDAVPAERNRPREERRVRVETNETDFKGYRKFEANSSITFGGDAGPGR